MSGKWEELIVIRGPQVTAATVSQQSIPVQMGTLFLSTDGAPIQEVRRYTTMERFRGNSGGFYVQLQPRSTPYAVFLEPHNPIVKTLRRGHDGRCFRIHGAKTIKEQAILIHEAPNVSWLTGCISPRPLGDYEQNYPNLPNTPPARTINE